MVAAVIADAASNLMNTLKKVLLLLIALCIVSAVTGIQSANVDINVTHGSTTSSAEITETSTYGRVLCLLYVIAFTAFYYGIHKRLLITWWLGWVVVVSTWVGFTLDVIEYIKPLPPSEFWINLAIAVIVGCAGLVYWGVWWRRQKSYFNIPASK